MEHIAAPAFRIFCCALLVTTALVGCSSKKSTTISMSGGTVAVEHRTDGLTSSVSGDQGEVKVGNVSVDPGSLGLPLYPGATQSNADSMTVNSPSRGVQAQVAVLTTTDAFDTVYDFYKSKMPADSEKGRITTSGAQLANFEVGLDAGKDVKSVVIREAGGKVAIRLLHETKQ